MAFLSFVLWPFHILRNSLEKKKNNDAPNMAPRQFERISNHSKERPSLISNWKISMRMPNDMAIKTIDKNRRS